MKIELTHEVKITGDEWYYIFIDGVCAAARRTLHEAEKEYERLKARGHISPVIETIKCEEVGS